MTAGNLATLIGTFVAVLTLGWSVIWSLLRRYLDARFETSDTKLVSLETTMDAKMDALGAKMDAKVDVGFKAVDIRFDTVDANHEALVRQMADNNRVIVQAIAKLTESQRQLTEEQRQLKESQRQTQALLTQLVPTRTADADAPDIN